MHFHSSANKSRALAWYESQAFAATQQMSVGRREWLIDQWENRYKITRRNDTSGATVLLSDAKDAPESYTMRGDEKEYLVKATLELGTRWGKCQDTIHTLRKMQSISNPVYFGGAGERHESLAGAVKAIEDANNSFQTLLNEVSTKHPVVLQVCRRLTADIWFRHGTPPQLRTANGSVLDFIEMRLIKALQGAYVAEPEVLRKFKETLVFGKDAPALTGDARSDPTTLRRSGATLIAERLAAGKQANASLWAQQPVHMRIDAAIAAGLRQTSDQASVAKGTVAATLATNSHASTPAGSQKNTQLDQRVANWARELSSDASTMLAQFGAPGTITYRARNEVVQAIKAKLDSDKAFRHAILTGINLAGLGLTPFTGTVSLEVAGAMDAIAALAEAGEAIDDYVQRDNLGKIAINTVDQMYWTAPKMCDLAAELADLALRVAGDVIIDGAASHLVDAVSIATMFMEIRK